MKIKNSNLLKNFSYSFGSNFIVMFVSAFSSLIIPKFINVEDYGFWQLFIFYSSYLPFFQLGWSEGIYLKLGGNSFKNLNKEIINGQIRLFVLFQFTLSGLLLIFGNLLVKNTEDSFLIYLLAISLFIGNTLTLLRILLEAVANFKMSGFSILIEKFLFMFILFVLLLSRNASATTLIMAELLGKFIALVALLRTYKTILLSKSIYWSCSLKEAFKNISVGSNLMLSNISNMLIIGVVRFGIEKVWSIATFAKISLILNFSNLISKFVNTVGLVLFPYLRRQTNNRQAIIYVIMRDIFSVSMLILFLVFFPLKNLLQWWLPKYTESIDYMAILFPISLFQGKVALLINPFLKAMRKEKELLRINTLSLLVSIVLTFITVLIAKKLTLAVTSIVISLAFRSYISELLISKELNIPSLKHNISEGWVIISFIFLGLYINTLLASLFYSVILFIYMLTYRSSLTNSFKLAVNVIKNN